MYLYIIYIYYTTPKYKTLKYNIYIENNICDLPTASEQF